MSKCFFCQFKTEPNYKDYDNLKKFTSPRGKILSKKITNTCPRHQKILAKHIKYARFLALIPYVSYQAFK